MKKSFIYFTYFISLIGIVIVNIKINKIFNDYECESLALLEQARINAASLLSSPATQSEVKLYQLVEIYADRELEIFGAEIYSYVFMFLYTALLIAFPVIVQLTIKSKAAHNNNVG
jgi:hypothetical protein